MTPGERSTNWYSQKLNILHPKGPMKKGGKNSSRTSESHPKRREIAFENIILLYRSSN